MKLRPLIIPIITVVVLTALGSLIWLKAKQHSKNLREEVARFSGTQSCRPCHENFYQLWQDSYHGLAMQPVTGDFIRINIHAFDQDVQVGSDTFKVIRERDTLFFVETSSSGLVQRYPAVHTMGGKYIYYFLTPFPGGRLQVLPLAYDCDTERWYNNPESGVRHFESLDDESLSWKSHSFTFNTTCYNCHVSQLETNYNLAYNSYNTTWREPGINCETCHGPSYDHIVECVKAGEGNIPKDLRIVQTSIFDSEQHNSACGSCHAKATVIARAFEPGGKFYDYFDLITLEHPDFYADGRDLGENYTMTTWEMNICATASDMHCVDCHTSSGRYRFAQGNANNACMPCHSERVENVTAHSFHKADSEGSKCISCHMPQTKFARMTRSDHSFRPPMPRATIAFGSPNACNICHSDRSPEWAENEIRKNHKTTAYQDETIANGMLIRKARENDWSEIDQIITGLREGRFDNVFATSFLRLLETAPTAAKWPAVRDMTRHTSPLVRGAAAHALYEDNSKESLDRLVALLDDEYRVVRLNAAYALSTSSMSGIPESDRAKIREALIEYETSLVTQTDSWTAHYNLGNYYSSRNEPDKALQSYNTSLTLYPEAILPMVNAGVIYYSLLGDSDKAEKMFIRALETEPGHEATLTNLALLYGEKGDIVKAEACYRELLKVSDRNSMAAYNLAVIISERELPGAVRMSRQAMEWAPDNPRYAYTYAFYLYRSGDIRAAENNLQMMITTKFPEYPDPYLLLADLYSGKNDRERALNTLLQAQKRARLSDEQQRIVMERIEQLKQNGD